MGQGVFGHARNARTGQLGGVMAKGGVLSIGSIIEFCTFETSSVTGSSYGTEDPGSPTDGISASVH